jgi:hypothetical protein
VLSRTCRHNLLRVRLVGFSRRDDTFCINQNDVKERTEQVARIHDVYTQAKTVHIWLVKGDAGKNARTFNFLRRILNLQQLEELVRRIEDKDDDEFWMEDLRDCKLTIDLMKAKWFSRRWVIQELALASRPHVRGMAPDRHILQ